MTYSLLQPLPAADPHETGFPPIVVRERLIRSLAQAPIALLVAPAGYGKSMLLSQWGEHDARPFAVVALREGHNDPGRALESIVRALADVVPIADDVFIALSRPAGLIVHEVLDRLEHSLATCDPFVLALDDVQVLEEAESLAALAGVADVIPSGSQVALASRREPALPIGRMRAQCRLVDVRTRDLAMTRREAARLFTAIGLDLEPDDVITAVRATEGWPAGLSLAAQAVLGEPDPARALRRLRGSNRHIADYLRDEIMAPLSAEEIEFLTRASILDVLSGPVCDATLGGNGSGALLRDLARANTLLVPLDQSDVEYRYHPLFADMLRAELRRGEPDLERELQGRAASWYAAHGESDRAVHHAVAGGDTSFASRLLWASVAPHVLSGRTAPVRSWLSRFGDDDVAAVPELALSTAAVHLVHGDRDLVEHWGAAAERASAVGADRDTVDAGVAIMRAAVCRNGLADMAAQAEIAYAAAADDSPWQSLSCLLQGVAAHLQRDPARARAYLEEGARRGGIAAPAIQVLCLAQLALLAIDAVDWSEAETLASRARSQVDRVGLADSPLAALVFAVSARVRAQRGRADEAQQDRRTTLSLLERLPEFAPWYTAEVRIVLAAAAVRRGDLVGSRSLVGDAARAMSEIPEAVVLADWVEQVEAGAATLAVSVARPASLTTAELRVLKLLPTPLSFRQMAGGLHVSANTVKTHAHAIYRKLDASSRSEAVERAREAGLLGDAPDELSDPLTRAA